MYFFSCFTMFTLQWGMWLLFNKNFLCHKCRSLTRWKLGSVFHYFNISKNVDNRSHSFLDNVHPEAKKCGLSAEKLKQVKTEQARCHQKYLQPTTIHQSWKWYIIRYTRQYFSTNKGKPFTQHDHDAIFDIKIQTR